MRLVSSAAALASCLALAGHVSAHGHRAPAAVKRATSPALNPKLTNTQKNQFPLYYNGSGPVPPYDMLSPPPTPITPYASQDAEDAIFQEIQGIIGSNATFTDGCTKCIAVNEIMHITAITQPPQTITNLLIRICNAYPGHVMINAATCESEFSGVGSTGPYYAQLFAKQSYATGDYQAFCFFIAQQCETPPVIQIDESQYFSPKPASANVAPAPSNQTISVLHMSDWHLDPRYDIGSEADCSQSLCCRPYSTNNNLGTGAKNPNLPASRFGSLHCDPPADLALSALNSMKQFFDPGRLAFTIFTGDIVSHDKDDQSSRAYVEYEENVTLRTFKDHMGNVPVYVTLGNHDTLFGAYNTPNVFNGPDGNIFSWNYDLLSSLWSNFTWLTPSEASYAATHYGGFAHTTRQGLRVISLNSDFWYNGNAFNYFNFTNPDPSGSLKWLADELTACEQRGQRAWVIAHVPTGYTGEDALPNSAALFQSIIIRFSPATIAAVFFGHTHEENYQIFYDYAASSLSPSSSTNSSGPRLRNTTDLDYSRPLQVGYIGASITPLNGLNSGYTLLHVDARTFGVTGSQTFFANMSESLTWPASGPVWQAETDLRTLFGAANAVDSRPWPSAAPLNATFFDRLTRAMERNGTLVDVYNLLETRQSAVTGSCATDACRRQKICYIRSASTAVSLKCGSGAGPS